jgi:hypothetical protein
MTQIRFGLIVFAYVLLALYAVFIQQDDSITLAQAGYTTLIIMLGTLPGVFSLIDRREAGLLPLMPLHGLFYALAFGLPVFSGKTDWSRVNSAVITDALVLTILGLVCLYLGYYVSRGLYSRSLQPTRFLNGVPLKRRIGIAWIMYGMSMLLQLVPALGSLPSAGQLSTPLGYLAMGILFLLALDKAVSKNHLILVTAAIGCALTIKLLSGSLAQAVFLLVLLGILYWGKKRSIPLGFILICGVIAILLNPIKQSYREYTRVAADAPSPSYVHKARMFYKATFDHYTNDDPVPSDGIDPGVVNRIGHSITVFADVINMTPEQVPYWRGGSYQTLWTSFIPRFLWPDKPQATIGNEFGHRYFFLGPTDTSTSHNLPWLPEFYANFGIIGVVGGMFAVGVLFRFLAQKLSVPIGSGIEYVLGATVTFSLFYAESNFALMAGGVLTTYLALLILLRLLTLDFTPAVTQRWRLTRRHFSR